MTIYICLKDLAYIPYFSDGSNTQSVIDWILRHRSHGENVKIGNEFSEGVATRC